METAVEPKPKGTKVVLQFLNPSTSMSRLHTFLQTTGWLLKVQKIDRVVRNAKFGVYFSTAEDAEKFYNDANFTLVHSHRPINCFLMDFLNIEHTHVYKLEGLNKKNLRRVFLGAKKVAPCRINTPWDNKTGQMEKYSTPKLIFYTEDEKVDSQALESFEEEMRLIGVGVKKDEKSGLAELTLSLSDFYAHDSTSKESILSQAQSQLCKMIKNVGYPPRSIKEYKIKTSEKETDVKASIRFYNTPAILEFYKKFKDMYAGENTKCKAYLNFHKSETNTYFCLFTSGLIMGRNSSEKQLENDFLRALNEVCSDIIQVRVFPMKRTHVYLAKVYFLSENSGKMFIGTYPEEVDIIGRFYKRDDLIKFDINADMGRLNEIKEKTVYANKIGQAKEKEDKAKNEQPAQTTTNAATNKSSANQVTFQQKYQEIINSASQDEQDTVVSKVVDDCLKEKQPLEILRAFTKNREAIKAYVREDSKNERNVRLAMARLVTSILINYFGKPENEARLSKDEMMVKCKLDDLFEFLQDPKNYYDQNSKEKNWPSLLA